MGGGFGFFGSSDSDSDCDCEFESDPDSDSEPEFESESESESESVDCEWLVILLVEEGEECKKSLSFTDGESKKLATSDLSIVSVSSREGGVVHTL